MQCLTFCRGAAARANLRLITGQDLVGGRPAGKIKHLLVWNEMAQVLLERAFDEPDHCCILFVSRLYPHDFPGFNCDLREIVLEIGRANNISRGNDYTRGR